MATAKSSRAQLPPQYTDRQRAAIQVAVALVGSVGYEILDHTDGEVADSIATRAIEIVDAVVEKAAS